MADENIETFELELQALQSVHLGDDVRLTRNDDSGLVTEIVVVVRPATCEDLEKQYLSIEVVFSIPAKYPVVAPTISFRNPRGVSEDELDSLSHTLGAIAEDLLGSEMLLPLVDAVKDCLTTHNSKPDGQCCICLEDFAPNEGITRTLCAHCFHSHCLADYIAHAIRELKKESSNEQKKNPAPAATNSVTETIMPCPFCRVPMQPLDVNYLRKQAPPVVKPSPQIDIHSEPLRLQQMELFNQLRLAREARLAEEAQKAAEEVKKAAAEAYLKSQPALANNGENLPVAAPSEKKSNEAGDTKQPVVNSSAQTSGITADRNDRDVRNDQRYSNYNRRYRGYDRGYNRQFYQNYDRNQPSKTASEISGGENDQQISQRQNSDKKLAKHDDLRADALPTKETSNNNNMNKSAPPRRQHPDNRNRGENYYQRQRHYRDQDQSREEDHFQSNHVRNSDNVLQIGSTSSSNSACKSLPAGFALDTQEHNNTVPARPPPGFVPKPVHLQNSGGAVVSSEERILEKSKHSDGHPPRMYYGGNGGRSYGGRNQAANSSGSRQDHSQSAYSNRNKQSSNVQ